MTRTAISPLLAMSTLLKAWVVAHSARPLGFCALAEVIPKYLSAECLPTTLLPRKVLEQAAGRSMGIALAPMRQGTAPRALICEAGARNHSCVTVQRT